MTRFSAETNLRNYEAPETAAHYAALDYLTACVRLLFGAYIKPGSAVLDLGVGGGRTTPYLASRATRYVGVDYSTAMVQACRTKFADVEFVVRDAADLSIFPDASFDAVVFAFNGIDFLVEHADRKACLRHIFRVLKTSGVMIFSSHNPRAILVRPAWNHERLRRMAARPWGGRLYGPVLAILTAGRFVIAMAQSLIATVPRVLRRLPSQIFWRGEGNLVEAVHGGLLTHYWTPSRAIEELAAVGFRPECVLGDDYPRASHRYATDWYYYVFTKIDTQ